MRININILGGTASGTNRDLSLGQTGPTSPWDKLGPVSVYFHSKLPFVPGTGGGSSLGRLSLSHKGRQKNAFMCNSAFFVPKYVRDKLVTIFFRIKKKQRIVQRILDNHGHRGFRIILKHLQTPARPSGEFCTWQLGSQSLPLSFGIVPFLNGILLDSRRLGTKGSMTWQLSKTLSAMRERERERIEIFPKNEGIQPSFGDARRGHGELLDRHPFSAERLLGPLWKQPLCQFPSLCSIHHGERLPCLLGVLPEPECPVKSLECSFPGKLNHKWFTAETRRLPEENSLEVVSLLWPERNSMCMAKSSAVHVRKETIPCRRLEMVVVASKKGFFWHFTTPSVNQSEYLDAQTAGNFKSSPLAIWNWSDSNRLRFQLHFSRDCYGRFLADGFFLWIFYFSAAGFFRRFCRRIFSSHFCGQ